MSVYQFLNDDGDAETSEQDATMENTADFTRPQRGGRRNELDYFADDEGKVEHEKEEVDEDAEEAATHFETVFLLLALALFLR